jgi:hypothetical protein
MEYTSPAFGDLCCGGRAGINQEFVPDARKRKREEYIKGRI